MSKPLDEMYFTWLYRQVGDPSLKNPTRTYWRMLKTLYTKEFVAVIPNDDNRIADGRDLRYEFVDDSNLDDVDPSWINMGCSMFELLVALSRRLAFLAEGEPRTWFWQMMENLGLTQYNDSFKEQDHVNDILDRVIWRTYDRDGTGGLFPVHDAQSDQREVEIWYQLSSYLLEMA